MYSNSKTQISLEEAYRQVHISPTQINESCCDACENGEDCECNDGGSFEVPPTMSDALETGKEIIYDGDDAGSELKKFLPLVFSSAAVDLGMDEQQASILASKLVTRLNIQEVESRISDLHAEKERLTDEAKYSMEAQVKLNRVIDDILKQGTYEALDILYRNPSNGMPPSKIVKALEKKIEQRISSRK
jgi:hypothetical protein